MFSSFREQEEKICCWKTAGEVSLQRVQEKISVKIEMKNHVRKVHFAKVVPCGLCAKQVKEVDMCKHASKYHPWKWGVQNLRQRLQRTQII